MGRRKTAPGYREARSQIRALMGTGDELPYGKRFQFLESIVGLQKRWIAAGGPNILDDRDISFDQDSLRLVYKGFKYEIRDLCDGFGILWPQGGILLADAISSASEGDLDFTELRIPADIPPRHHWKWFRVARTGLGMLREEEKVALNVETLSGKQINLSKGLTHEQIRDLLLAETEKPKSVRAIGPAVGSCWNYLENEGNIEYIGEFAGYSEIEKLMMVFALIGRRITNTE